MIPSFRILTFKNSTYPTVCSRLFSIRWGCQCEIYWSWNNFHKWMCRSRDNLKRNYHKVQVYFVKRSNILLQYLFHVILLLFMVLDLQILITQKKKKQKEKTATTLKLLFRQAFGVRIVTLALRTADIGFITYDLVEEIMVVAIGTW